jgi:hypothetical protein
VKRVASAVCSLAVLLTTLGAGWPPLPARGEPAEPEPRFRAGTIEAKAIPESSGLVASRRHAGVFWTVNDSGNAPVLYAITRQGKLIAEFPVDAENVDWEDLAIDDAGHLYIADVGNNDGGRAEVRVLRLDEPDPGPAAAAAADGEDEGEGPRRPGEKPAAPLPVGATWRLTYPGKPFDCESLVVRGRDGFLISKRRDAGPAELYRFDLAPAAGPVALVRVGALPIRAPVTAADVSPDGKRLAVLTVLGPWVFEIDGDVASATAADAPPARYSRYIHPTMEAACFVPGGLLVTAESREVFFFADRHFTPVERPAGR